MREQLQEALNNITWLNHEIGDTYNMPETPLFIWRIAYYPIFEDGKTKEIYSEPRALIERKAMFGKIIGIDFREVPLRYLLKIENTKCDGCGKYYDEPNKKYEFGEFNICPPCEKRNDLQFE